MKKIIYLLITAFLLLNVHLDGYPQQRPKPRIKTTTVQKKNTGKKPSKKSSITKPSKAASPKPVSTGDTATKSRPTIPESLNTPKPDNLTSDAVVGKTASGQPVYEGSRGGHYYINNSGKKSYVEDFIGAKVVGKTKDGQNIYEGPHGGHFYYNSSGSKVYVRR